MVMVKAQENTQKSQNGSTGNEEVRVAIIDSSSQEVDRPGATDPQIRESTQPSVSGG